MSIQQSTYSDTHKPYKGLDSYQLSDGELFFGREQEAKQLTAHILSRRFSLLYAPSGVGKTSLLNARVIPNLEKNNWLAVRILPQNDPIASIRLTTLQYLAPPLSAELKSIVDAEQVLAKGKDLTLEELLNRFDNLPVWDEDKRTLVDLIIIQDSPNEKIFPPGLGVDTFFSRLLRSTIDVGVFARYINGFRRSKSSPINEHTRISHIKTLLSQRELHESYRLFLQILDVPIAGLWPFFKNLFEVYGRQIAHFNIVLVLDQFEEVFTRFVDRKNETQSAITISEFSSTPVQGSAGSNSIPSPIDLPSYHLRDKLFEEFEELYTRRTATIDRSNQTDLPRMALLPIRFVVSMREEYIAAFIEEARHIVGEIDNASYRLSALSKWAAKTAIAEPARFFGYKYSDEAYEAVINGLARENKYIEPTQLQIVCEKIWNKKGREIAQHSQAGNDHELPQIEKKVLDDLKGVKNILRSFFNDFLDSEFPIDEKDKNKDKKEERQEALELLRPLITSSRTRNIVQRQELIHYMPLRKPDLRTKLLEILEKGRIVRTEERLEGHFVEITHEFMIDPIMKSIRKNLTEDIECSRYGESLHELALAESTNFRVGTQYLLSEETFRTLHNNRRRVAWPDWGIELMYRSAVFHDLNTETTQLWANQFQSHCLIQEIEPLLENLKKYESKRRTLRLGQLRLLNKQRSSLTNLTVQQLEHIVRSELNEANDLERDDIVYWMEQWLNKQAGERVSEQEEEHYEA